MSATHRTIEKPCSVDNCGGKGLPPSIVPGGRHSCGAVPERQGCRLTSRQHHPDDTVIRVGDHRIGGGGLAVIAGPCAVESRDQMHRTVSALVRHGVGIIRGGAYKPRTSPYDFQGLGQEGLDLLAEMKREYGVKVITELTCPSLLGPVFRVADILQIGSRNCQNYDLLRAAAGAGMPVMLKRGMAASVAEWLSSAEHLMAHGCSDVILCERGIKTFETVTRNTLDVGAVAVLKLETHLPVLVDPSHAAGNRELVLPLAMAGVAAGADGVMVEVHCDPDSALCDGPQQLTLDMAGELMRRLGK